MSEPMRVTMVFEDNPLAGRPGQAAYTIAVSSEPDLELPEDGSLPDPNGLPVSLVAAVECMRHIAGMSAEMALVQIARGSNN